MRRTGASSDVAGVLTTSPFTKARRCRMTPCVVEQRAGSESSRRRRNERTEYRCTHRRTLAGSGSGLGQAVFDSLLRGNANVVQTHAAFAAAAVVDAVHAISVAVTLIGECVAEGGGRSRLRDALGTYALVRLAGRARRALRVVRTPRTIAVRIAESGRAALIRARRVGRGRSVARVGRAFAPVVRVRRIGKDLLFAGRAHDFQAVAPHIGGSETGCERCFAATIADAHRQTAARGRRRALARLRARRYGIRAAVARQAGTAARARAGRPTGRGAAGTASARAATR